VDEMETEDITIQRECNESECESTFTKKEERYNVPTRPRALKLVRTIADLDISDIIKEHHLAAAIQFQPRCMFQGKSK
jgi:predicted ATPase with chaperone activity